MRSQLPENALVTLLRQCYLSPRCQSTSRRLTRPRPTQSRSVRTKASREPSRQLAGAGFCRPVWRAGKEEHDHVVGVAQPLRNYSTSDGPKTYKSPQNVAVLGGGISGLASAYYLSKELPLANITLYEATDRLGGWIQSKRVDVGNGSVVFEQGPRTLRPGPPPGLVTLELIKQLGLENEMLITGTNTAAAISRHIYYPDRLVELPGQLHTWFEILWMILREPIFEGWSEALFEYKRPKRPSSLEDESIGSWLNRRLGSPSIGDNIASAIFHGIYAGDIYQLSMKSLMTNMWYLENPSLSSSLWKNFASRSTPMQYRDAMLAQEMRSKPQDMALTSNLGSVSVYSFKEGVAQLSDSIAAKLKGNSKVQIMTDTKVSNMSYDGKTDSVRITTSKNKPPISYDRVISTIPSFHLAALPGSKNPATSLASTHAVTVMTVNLYYPTPNILPVAGFGYLIPRSVPLLQNPEHALGVVFDSDAVTGLDTVPGTKVTVMLGGHWWDNYLPSDYPTEDEASQMAQAVLKRHMNIEARPAKVLVGLHRDCIPQYTVGHEQRMKDAHSWLIREFRGKLAVAGSSYTGVGINDCIRAARDTALDVAQYQGPSGITGLEQFVTERKWVLITPVLRLETGRSERSD